jgi:hypothetical protein
LRPRPVVVSGCRLLGLGQVQVDAVGCPCRNPGAEEVVLGLYRAVERQREREIGQSSASRIQMRRSATSRCASYASTGTGCTVPAMTSRNGERRVDLARTVVLGEDRRQMLPGVVVGHLWCEEASRGGVVVLIWRTRRPRTARIRMLALSTSRGWTTLTTERLACPACEDP